MHELLEAARKLDRSDPLGRFRDRFCIPPGPDGDDMLYFCGHSLGLQPKAAESAVLRAMAAWRDRAVEGHFKGDRPWLDLPDSLRDALAALTGAQPGEITVMNTLTVNLHLLMLGFYRPEGRRRKILVYHAPVPQD